MKLKGLKVIRRKFGEEVFYILNFINKIIERISISYSDLVRPGLFTCPKAPKTH